jgi:CHASE2 domain-containing sensor protein
VAHGASTNDANDPKLLEATKPTRFLQSDDKRIVDLARKAVGDAKDAVQAARRIEAFVAKYIDNKSMSVGYASAVEVVESRQGDCSEFAVLTAALCRAIAIVVVDEESIRRIGRWPWTRNIHSALIEKLNKAGAKAIVFDILFLDPDTDHPRADSDLGKTIARSPQVVLGAFFQKITADGLPAEISYPIKVLNDVASIGFVNIYTELDGINRKIPLVVEYDKALVPSLVMSGLAQFLGKSPRDIIVEGKIPMNEYNEMTINYLGGYQTFPYYPYYQVLDGSVNPGLFKDKLVLVGGTATALFDFKAVPFRRCSREWKSMPMPCPIS